MRAAILLSAGLVAGCTVPAADDTGDNVGDADPTAPLADLSDGGCPDFSLDGPLVIRSGGADRTFRVYWPDGATEGAGVLFMWHPLGASAQQFASWMGAAELAVDQDLVVVAPSSRSDNPFEWDFWNGGTGDLTLYDDLRTCLVTELGVDTRRFATTGMSAGGLWSTYLTIHRGDTLATAYIMSGGSGQSFEYATPASRVPVVVMWGGPTDSYSNGVVSMDFAQASQELAAELKADGHFVVECEHDQGHDIPLAAIGGLEAWVPGHVYGQPSPFESSALEGLPSWCEVGTVGPE